ncbi:sialin-like [Anastrepha obliqua]|uniref:sialin-like n=1 Tax=Anastrepha obliqua TaxID=95512 RepID=UPI0024098642|nr:sialin-like [Anastrepha obliqua]
MTIEPRFSIQSNSQIRHPIFGVRYLQCLLISCGLCFSYATRVNISMAIVAMMDNKGANPDFPEYIWSEKTKSHILSSFFFGYLFTQIPAGGWARRFGGHLLLFISVSASSILGLLTPLSINVGGWPLLCVLRFCQGLFQGATNPTLATIIVNWAPTHERSVMLTYCTSGTELGIVIMLATSGILCSSSWGWPSTFYLPGALGLLWAVLWFVLGASTPNECKYISTAERVLIATSLGHNARSEECQTVRAIPWMQIMTSKPFLVLALSQCASSWCFWTLLTQLPSYIKNVLGKDIQSNAFYSALPYFSMLCLSLALCPVASYLEKSKRLNATISRKIFNTIGLWIPAVTFVYLGFIRTDNGDLAISLLTLTVTISTVVHFGYQVNHLDLSPHFAGTLTGIANTAANVMSIMAPLIVGYIVTDATNIYQWRIIFCLAGGISFFGNLMFLIFGTAKVQPWNEEPKLEEKNKKYSVELPRVAQNYTEKSDAGITREHLA